jgi:hypothetical protein
MCAAVLDDRVMRFKGGSGRAEKAVAMTIRNLVQPALRAFFKRRCAPVLCPSAAIEGGMS